LDLRLPATRATQQPIPISIPLPDCPAAEALGKALRPEYEIAGFDLRTDKSDFPIIGMDPTSG
jgi:hypothetical protein